MIYSTCGFFQKTGIYPLAASSRCGTILFLSALIELWVPWKRHFTGSSQIKIVVISEIKFLSSAQSGQILGHTYQMRSLLPTAPPASAGDWGVCNFQHLWDHLDKKLEFVSCILVLIEDVCANLTCSVSVNLQNVNLAQFPIPQKIWGLG